MAPANVRDRDAGMRRISSATRWMAGLGLGLTAALTGFFAARAQSATTTSSGSSISSSQNPQVSPGDDTSSGASAPSPAGGSSSNGAGSSVNGFPQLPRSHTRSGGS